MATGVTFEIFMKKSKNDDNFEECINFGFKYKFGLSGRRLGPGFRFIPENRGNCPHFFWVKFLLELPSRAFRPKFYGKENI